MVVDAGTVLAVTGAGIAVGLSAIGSGIGVGIAGATGAGVIAVRPEKFGRALDELYAARDLLTDHTPSPAETYDWSWCKALKMYCIGLARLVERDWYASQKQSDLQAQVSSQAIEWAGVLTSQAQDWYAVECADEIRRQSRDQWLRRFQAAINGAKK